MMMMMMMMMMMIIIIIIIIIIRYQHRIINMIHNLCYRTHELYYDRSTKTDRTVRSNRPDAVMLDRTLKEACLVVQHFLTITTTTELSSSSRNVRILKTS